MFIAFPAGKTDVLETQAFFGRKYEGRSSEAALAFF